MADVVVSVHRFAGGDLPHLCALTARPTEEVVRLTVANGPVSVGGWLPLSGRGRAKARILDVGSWLALAAATVAWVLYLVTPEPPYAMVGLAVGLLAVGSVWARGRTRVGGRLEDDGVSVRLVHVHPRFATAVTRTKHAAEP